MKALIVLLVLCASISSAQITEQVVKSSIDSGYVTTTKKKINFTDSYYKISRAFIFHDTTDYARSPYLCYGYDNDTTLVYTFKLRPGEWVDITGISLLHLYIWASTGTVPYRVRIERGGG